MSDELAAALSAGRQAAFHGPPGDGIEPLQQAIALARRDGRMDDAGHAVWLLGVCLTATGRLGTALAILSPVLEHAETEGVAAPPAVRAAGARCAAVMAAAHRQLGRAGAAAELDARGLALTDGTGEAAADCRIGLVADAAALGETARAAAELAEAERIVDPHSWRLHVRLDWARSELAQLEGRPDDAVAAVQRAGSAAEAAGAPRHVARSLLMLGLLRVRADDPQAADVLAAAAERAADLGLLPLAWPAYALIGALRAGDPAASKAALTAAREAVEAIAADLPDDVRAGWLARPDVAALVAA